jgi:hypothetical protein
VAIDWFGRCTEELSLLGIHRAILERWLITSAQPLNHRRFQKNLWR